MHIVVHAHEMAFALDVRNEIVAAFYYYVDYVEVKELPKDMGRFCAWYNHELTEALPEGENEWRTLGPQGHSRRVGPMDK